MRLTLAFLALVIASVTACKSQDNTKIVVVVRSNLAIPTELDSVRIDAIGPTATVTKTFALATSSGSGKTTLPIQLQFVPDDDKKASFKVKTTGLLGQNEIVVQTAKVTFVAGQSLFFEQSINRDCVAVPCSSDNDTCANGVCNKPITDFELKPYDPSKPPTPFDAATVPDSALDSGVRDGRGLDIRTMDTSEAGTTCTNACVLGATECVSSSSLATCTMAVNGCTVGTSSLCSTGLVCERYGNDECLDPNWAEWPITNNKDDVAQSAPNPASFTDNKDGTVTDNVTGLMWQASASGEGMSWEGAKTSCAAQATGGYKDWRLPTLIELLSIVDHSVTDPSIDGSYFPSTPPQKFWTLSIHAGTSGDSWYVHFATGQAYWYSVAVLYYVRCVR